VSESQSSSPIDEGLLPAPFLLQRNSTWNLRRDGCAAPLARLIQACRGVRARTGRTVHLSPREATKMVIFVASCRSPLAWDIKRVLGAAAGTPAIDRASARERDHGAGRGSRGAKGEGLMFSLDHVAVAVGDLAKARQDYVRLGFALSALGLHYAPGPDGALRPSGTGNHCAMLESGYLELIGVTDPGYAGRLKHDLARYEGVHLIAVGCPNAMQAVLELRERGVEVGEPRRLNRPIEDGGRSAMLSFSLVDMPASIFPEGHVFAIEHHTRAELWRAELLRHPNGARALRRVFVCVREPWEFATRWQGCFGAGTHVDAASASDIASRFAGVIAPCMPWIAGFSVAVADLGAAAALLDANGVAFRRHSSGVFVAPAQACGAIVEFVEA
jgi:catechol 2,3-dioxygenase-like lactoylglutathione lyase family enzyme